MKHRVLMEVEERPNDAGFYTYVSEDDDLAVALSAERYFDLDRPGRVTVTVERGDMLNEEGAA